MSAKKPPAKVVPVEPVPVKADQPNSIDHLPHETPALPIVTPLKSNREERLLNRNSSPKSSLHDPADLKPRMTSVEVVAFYKKHSYVPDGIEIVDECEINIKDDTKKSNRREDEETPLKSIIDSKANS